MRTERNGFTLIELLVVVAIIGILAALIIPSAVTAMQRSKVRAAQKDIQLLTTFLTDYVTDKAVPPANNGDIGTEVKTALAPAYTKVVPLTDQWGAPYRIYTGSNITVYGISGASIDDFLVCSTGRDRTVESWTYNTALPEGGLYNLGDATDFNRDLVSYNGQFIRGPRTGTSGS